MDQTKQPVQQPTQQARTPPVQQSQVQAQAVQPKPGVPAGTQPGVQPCTQPVKMKSKWWIWLIIVLVVIGFLAASYFIFIK